MPVVRKFDFDLSFDPAPPAPPAAAAPVEPVPAEPESEPEPSFSAAELEEVRALALAEGREAGARGAMEALERRVAAACDTVAAALDGLAAEHAGIREATERRAAGLMLTVFRKLAPALLARSGTTEIEALLDEVFRYGLGEPRLVVRCPPDLLAAIEPLVRETGARSGYEGKLAVLGDARLAGDACRVEWAEGGVERSSEQMMETIEAAMLRSIAEFDRRRGLAPPSEESAEEAAA
jgi:flagellar assembly protein FliH